MNEKGRNRLKVLEGLERSLLSKKVATQQLKIGPRQLCRLLATYRLEGDQAVVSKRHGKKTIAEVEMAKKERKGKKTKVKK